MGRYVDVPGTTAAGYADHLAEAARMARAFIDETDEATPPSDADTLMWYAQQFGRAKAQLFMLANSAGNVAEALHRRAGVGPVWLLYATRENPNPADPFGPGGWVEPDEPVEYSTLAEAIAAAEDADAGPWRIDRRNPDGSIDEAVEQSGADRPGVAA